MFSKNADHIYHCEPLQRLNWFTHGFSTRQTKNAGLGVTMLRQIHSAQVQNARGLTDRVCEGDALVSNEIGKRIGVRTADCVPLLLVDTQNRAVSAIHAGWRGTAASIVTQTVERMAQDFGSDSLYIHAAIGPCIRACCYEVGEEVLAKFQQLFPVNPPVVVENNRIKLDLVEANRRLLEQAGIQSSQIYDSKLCTYCAPEEFYSYRRTPSDPGRLISFVGRTE